MGCRGAHGARRVRPFLSLLQYAAGLVNRFASNGDRNPYADGYVEILMMELLLDQKDAALVLLKEIAELKRYQMYNHFTVNVPAHLFARIDLVLDLLPGSKP